MAAITALQDYGGSSDSESDHGNTLEDLTLHLKPVDTDSTSASKSQDICISSAPAVATKVRTFYVPLWNHIIAHNICILYLLIV